MRGKNLMRTNDEVNIQTKLGILEWFRIGEYDRVKAILKDLEDLNIKYLRTAISWADWYTQGGKEWYSWLIPEISSKVDFLPCVSYTPPSLGIEAKTSSPPRNTKDYADFIDEIINRFGKNFEWIELWNEPNNLNDWDWRLDPSWKIFADMIVKSAYWAKQLGKKTVLGGMAPTDPNWLSLMCEGNVLNDIDAVAIHGFPGTWEYGWDDWGENIKKVDDVLTYYNLKKEIWITEAGYSTWRHDEHKQLVEFYKLLKSHVKRVYYYSAQDLHPTYSHQDGFHEDERHYHFGLKKADGTPKLTYRILLKEGLEGVKYFSGFKSCNHSENHYRNNGKSHEKSIVVLGGAGFIGTNTAHHFLSQNKKVTIFDNLSRPGVEDNLRWLNENHSKNLNIEIGDVRNPYFVAQVVKNASVVFNFAAQVAVTTSLIDPITDFEINARGTLNVLEGIRRTGRKIPVVFTSTNKVYGSLSDIKLYENGTRYVSIDENTRERGVSETRSLDFHSPYGCSKGTADQYILDYARSYDIPTVVFRMSCIYGTHQCGNEDQGWVAHFVKQTLNKERLNIYGSGKQVRDILFVEDLVNAFQLVLNNIELVKGNAFNIGGGMKNSISLLELIEIIKSKTGRNLEIDFYDWRTGDQKYYVTDTSKFKSFTNWSPYFDVDSGLDKLIAWLQMDEVRKASAAAPVVSRRSRQKVMTK